MSRWTIPAVYCVILAAQAVDAASPPPAKKGGAAVELFKSPDVVTIWSLQQPLDNAAHTFIITHGLSGSEKRFFELGWAILALEPGANVLVIEWDPAKKERIGAFGNPWAAAKRIDLTGDALGSALADLHKKKSLDLGKTTFIGESFGNYVNHRAALALGKAGCGKVHGALALNPASELGGYEPPLLTHTYIHSVAFVSDSILDTRKPIAARTVHLKTSSDDAFVQHTYGLEWLHAKTMAGERVHTHFEAPPELTASK